VHDIGVLGVELIFGSSMDSASAQFNAAVNRVFDTSLGRLE
jgi:hypothetical protein